MITFVAKKVPAKLPEVKFIDASNAERSLSEWHGKVVLLNLWATWCAPCRKEMPTLDALNKDLGGVDFDVVAISIDRGGLAKPKRFLDQIKVEKIALYNDKKGSLVGALRALGMPTTLLIDREGRELGRLVGPAEWNSEDAKRLINAAIALGR